MDTQTPIATRAGDVERKFNNVLRKLESGSEAQNVSRGTAPSARIPADRPSRHPLRPPRYLMSVISSGSGRAILGR